MKPLHIHLDEVHIDLGHGVQAQGSGDLDVATPWGPRLSFDGEVVGDGNVNDLLRVHPEESGPAGELYVLLEHPFSGKGEGYLAKGLWRWADAETVHNWKRITGTYTVERVTVAPARAPEPKGFEYLLVNYLGRSCGLWPTSKMFEDIKYLEGNEFRYGDHRFVLANTDQDFRRHITWTEAGTFAYIGPAIDQRDLLDTLLTHVSLLLGAAFVAPVDPVGLVRRASSGHWLNTEWRRPTKRYFAHGHDRVVGAELVHHGGEHLTEWLEAGLQCWDSTRSDLGLELTLRYLDQMPSRPEPEMRCLDLVVAIERLTSLFLRARANAACSQSKLRHKIITFQKEVGKPVLGEQDVKVIHELRRCLGHIGDLPMERRYGLGEDQLLHLTEGWLITCFHRLLAAVFGVDVPLADLGALGHPVHRPSEGGFVGPPFTLRAGAGSL